MAAAAAEYISYDKSSICMPTLPTLFVINVKIYLATNTFD